MQRTTHRRRRVLAGLVVVAGLAGCAAGPNPPLIFGQSQTLGVTVAGSPASQGGEFTVGYRDWNFAVVPVTVTQGDGTVTALTASANNDEKSDHQDAFSTLGQFEASADGGTEPTVTLGKFFATGLAAKTLADGFKAKLAGEADEGGN